VEYRLSKKLVIFWYVVESFLRNINKKWFFRQLCGAVIPKKVLRFAQDKLRDVRNLLLSTDY